MAESNHPMQQIVADNRFQSSLGRRTLFAFGIAIASSLQSTSLLAAESPESFTLDGKLYSDSAGTTPLVDNSVTLKLRILNPGKDCVLYEEQQVISTIPTNGSFSVEVGSPVGDAKRTGPDPDHSMTTVFQNSTNISGFGAADGLPCTHTAASAAKRHLRVLVTAPSLGGGERTLSPDLAMSSLPHALVAGRAESLQGFTSDQFLKVNTTAGAQLTQANLEAVFSSSANVTSLNTLIAGTNSNYVRSVSNDGARIPTYAGNPSTPSVGSIWYDSVDQNIKLQTAGGTVAVGSGGGSLPAAAGTAASPGYAFTGDTNTGVFGAAADAIGLSTAGTERLRVTATGNVGIGVTAPDRLLQVAGPIRINPSALPTATAAVAGDIAIDSGDGNKLKFHNGTAWVEAGGSGGSGLPAAAGTAAAPGYAFLADTDTGVFGAAADAVGITTAGVERMRVSSTGQVAIGTATANSRLTISGAATSRTNIIASGATVDLSLSNNHLLKAPGGAALTLQNLADGGTYTLVIEDTTVRTYTFAGCDASYFSPANGDTLFRSSYTILAIDDGGTMNCYISWSTGFN